MVYLLYFLVVLAVLPVAHLILMRWQWKNQTAVFAVAGVVAWVTLRLLLADAQVNRFWAFVAVVAAVVVYDRLFAVRFQDR